MVTADDRIYLDHNATSPLRPEARDAVERALSSAAANPSSLHAEGRAARAAIEIAREQVAALLGVAPAEIVFTSGGSEAISAAVRGVADRAPVGVRRLVVPTVEHSAVLETARGLARQGFECVGIGCDAEGRVPTDDLAAAIDERTALVCLQWANNETGVLQPVEEAGRRCRALGVPFFVDAVQAAGKVEVEPRRVHADLVALSSHKLGGPAGAGALIVRDGIELAPLIAGGAQETRRRAGTPQVAAIVGFGAAAAAADTRRANESRRLLGLRAKIETRLRAIWPEVRFHGQAAPRLANTVNFALPGADGETLAIALDLAGFAVSTGSACASGAVEPSHVIRAMGRGEDEARGAVRVSLGWSTRPEDVERFLEALPGVVERVRGDRAGGVGLADRA